MKSCVVTGAGSGIGQAVSAKFLEEGWFVVGVEINNETLEATQRQFNNKSFKPLSGNVADTEILEQARHFAEENGDLSCWVNNAGYNIRGMAHEIDEETYRRGLSVVLDGTFWGTAIALRSMLEHKVAGSIVQIGSGQGQLGLGGGWAAYAMCKAGIGGLTRQVAADYGQFGIRCNVVAPGLIDTPINKDILGDHIDAEAKAEVARWASPLNTVGEAKDIAHMVYFLAEQETARFITGQTYLVDGGLTTCEWWDDLGPH